MVVSQSLSHYEPQTQAIARELWGATQEPSSLWTQLRDQIRWEDRLLDFAIAHPGLRVQLFRFIDTLPALSNNTEIARHLQEYLTSEGVELPGVLKRLLAFTEPDSTPGRLAATTVAPAVKALAYRFIAGANLTEVLKAIEHLRSQQLGCTLDLLGEAVISENEAQAYLHQYLDLMAQLSEAAQHWSPIPTLDQADDQALSQVQVSVKLTAFYSQFNPLDAAGTQAQVSPRIRTLLRRAQELGVGVHFDMEQYRYKSLTLAILKDILMESEFRQRDDIGLTLQAYLRESQSDLYDLIAWAKQRGTPITVRLVKGAYWDQETIRAVQHHWPSPVYGHKQSTDANFEHLTRLLLERYGLLYAAIGSHNLRSQAHALAIAESLSIPRRHLEHQVLYGMAPSLAKALAKRGARVRVYAPFGELIPGMAYLIRRLLENTANSSVLRQTRSDQPMDMLLRVPEFAPEDQLSPETSAQVPDWVSPFANAADTDYAIAARRTQATAALQTVHQHLGQRYLPIINGESVPTDTEAHSLNPANPAQIIGTLGLASKIQAEQAIAAAKAAFPAWANTPICDRAAILRRAAEGMEARRHELNAWIVLEVGKTLAEADPETSEAIDFCRFYADEMERLAAGHTYDYPGETNRYRYHPHGLALVISPWNFPLAITTGMTVAALVAGNCTLLKPATCSGVVAAKLAEILLEAGVPKGVFQFLPASGTQVGIYMVRDPEVHLIAFTGSQAVGCQIYAEAAQLRPGQKHLKRVVAEMGGKNAIIIDESADLDQAVQGVVNSAFSYSGQKCSACSRVIVLEAIYERFVPRLIEATRSLVVGVTTDLSTTVGPVIDAAAQAQIQDYIATGKREATLALELPAPETGYFIGPTIFTDVAPNAVIAQTEIFGPVLAVIKAQTFDQALEIANQTDYGLTGGLYSRTPSHIERAQIEFEVGNLYINRGTTGAVVCRQPFGGFKLSGVGSKAGGPDYLMQFLQPRQVSENTQRQGFAPLSTD
ncbi:L-glutamate gamma-semialdehyde dehydrogenase [Synechococcales cyanobacterium C]|uniref:L-glutamate gamma-semialdehyde dehydrogenase n=1 Tax=Petrachloros mirabilis ULC683 TaxID=2781853 RepID=A0A8K2A721_9CYAN|nr:L-glutamate gamma-semialdehyde dehydrogenase [Petrachloros mirabilis]NCJ05585.1 L-glutamate gamma-semialdehyde dehydrogenase [Petrachloros mirabilis ULC683]